MALLQAVASALGSFSALADKLQAGDGIEAEVADEGRRLAADAADLLNQHAGHHASGGWIEDAGCFFRRACQFASHSQSSELQRWFFDEGKDCYAALQQASSYAG